MAYKLRDTVLENKLPYLMRNHKPRLTQADLASILAVSRPTVASWCSMLGTWRRIPGPENQKKLSKLFRKPFSQIMKLEDAQV